MYDSVAEFHKAFGLTVAQEPGLPDDKLRLLRVKLLDEEIKEYFTADDENDLVNLAKELADIAYIACGTAITYGIAPGSGKFELPLANLPGFPAWPSVDERKIMRDYVTDLLKEYIIAEHDDDLNEIDARLTNILYTVGDIAYSHGYEFGKIFDAVHKSNMSKLMPDGTALRRSDGKVQKGPNYAPPDISSIIIAAQKLD